MIAYEAAPAFEPAMAAAVRDDAVELALPLAWVAVFDDATVIRRAPHEPSHAAARVPAAAVVPAPWTPSLTRMGFSGAIARVAAFIAAGDTYQVNYTFALEREGAGPIEIESDQPVAGRREVIDAGAVAREGTAAAQGHDHLGLSGCA